MARGATLTEVDNTKLRQRLARKKSFSCTDVKIRDLTLFYEAVNRGGAPRWRGPTKILDIDGAGVTVKYHSQTFKVAPYCVREEAEGKDLRGVDWDPWTPGIEPRWRVWRKSISSLRRLAKEAAIQTRQARSRHGATLECRHVDQRLAFGGDTCAGFSDPLCDASILSLSSGSTSTSCLIS